MSSSFWKEKYILHHRFAVRPSSEYLFACSFKWARAISHRWENDAQIFMTGMTRGVHLYMVLSQASVYGAALKTMSTSCWVRGNWCNVFPFFWTVSLLIFKTMHSVHVILLSKLIDVRSDGSFYYRHCRCWGYRHFYVCWLITFVTWNYFTMSANFSASFPSLS